MGWLKTRTRIVVAAFLVVIVLTVGGTVYARVSTPDAAERRLSFCQRYIQQQRADACELLEDLGRLGGP